MCVCESISPGSTVALERSITLASLGIAAELSMTSSIRPPRTTISWSFLDVLLLPSIKVPARITINVPGACGSAWPCAILAHSNASVKEQIKERPMENLLKGAASLPQTGAGLQPSSIALSVVVHLRLEQINYSDKASRAVPVETGDIRCREPAQVE